MCRATLVASVAILVLLFGCDRHKPTLAYVAPVTRCLITLRWKPPTEYEDGTPFTPEDIQKFTLNWYNQDQSTIVSVDVNDPTAVMWTLLNMPAGKMSFQINVTDQEDRTSDWSNIVTAIFDSWCDEKWAFA